MQSESESSVYMMNKKGQEIYTKDFPAEFRLEFLASASHPQDSYYMNYNMSQFEAVGLSVQVHAVNNTVEKDASSVKFDDIMRIEGHVWGATGDKRDWEVNWFLGAAKEVKNDFIGSSDRLIEISCIETYCAHNI